jgi:hypothetical protein
MKLHLSVYREAYDIRKEKNALAKPAYSVAEYTVSNHIYVYSATQNMFRIRVVYVFDK